MLIPHFYLFEHHYLPVSPHYTGQGPPAHLIPLSAMPRWPHRTPTALHQGLLSLPRMPFALLPAVQRQRCRKISPHCTAVRRSHTVLCPGQKQLCLDHTVSDSERAAVLLLPAAAHLIRSGQGLHCTPASPLQGQFFPR